MNPSTLSKSYLIKTLGCKANFSDSQALESELQKRGWIPALDDSHADLCIVNSCTVTNEADKQSRGMAKRIAKKNPKTHVLFTGCGAEVDPSSYQNAPGIHYVVGNQNKPELIGMVIDQIEKSQAPPESTQILGSVTDYTEMRSHHPLDREWPMPIGMNPDQWIDHGNTARTRVFLKIQEGCDSFCTYCIIPYGRGPSRSLRPRIILEQIENLVRSGVMEVVLTGTNIGEYGVDWSENKEMMLTELISQILTHTELPRLRVSSLDPTEVTPEMLSVMAANPRFCPHFHISLQSPHSKVLRLMKRKYNESHASRILNQIAELKLASGEKVFVGMDLITGFPGEGGQEFIETVQWLESHPWSRLHVFPYSERSGTPATKLPLIVPKEERSRRAKILMNLSTERLTRVYHERLGFGGLKEVLIEGNSGYTPHYLKVLFRDTHYPNNTLIDVLPTEVMIDRNSGDVAYLASPIR